MSDIGLRSHQLNPQDPIPVIDLFAGPGGLGEGFASLGARGGASRFKIALSVEMDWFAHRTLELRAFYRQFTDEDRPPEYYAYVADPTPAARDALFAQYPLEAKAASHEAWRHELSEESAEEVTERARQALRGRDDWVLVGGPPCQAYSLVGRSRRKNDRSFKEDAKHTLYKHYLRLVNDLKPPVFVMENVKGILSSRLGKTSAIDLVLRDLGAAGDGYEIHSFVADAPKGQHLSPADYVIRSEDYGIPQTRHRVILLGVSKQIGQAPAKLRRGRAHVSVEQAIGELPALRSHLSNRHGVRDNDDIWVQHLKTGASAINKACRTSDPRVSEMAVSVAGALIGARDTPRPVKPPEALASWYQRDHRLLGVLNHAARSHMPSDLTRYLYCATFAKVHGRSASLRDFPHSLLPQHKNVQGNSDIAAAAFADRFRVQVADEPAKTITSHIAKDGHYYIHYDPSQCRSLTVREAARLQTFPDDYFFEGNRTQQYHQVGNAVPPFLAVQLAGVVAGLLDGRSSNTLSVDAAPADEG